MDQNNRLEDIRSQWQAMKVDGKRLEEANRKLSDRLAAERAGSRQRHLAARYRYAGILSMVLLPVLSVELHEVVDVPSWLCVLYAAVGVALGALNLGFSFFISNSDYLSLSTCDAVAHVRKVLLWQARLRSTGLALAAVVLVPLFVHFASLDDSILLVSTGVGLVLGAAIGMLIYSRNRRLARRIVAELEA